MPQAVSASQHSIHFHSLRLTQYMDDLYRQLAMVYVGDWLVECCIILSTTISVRYAAGNNGLSGWVRMGRKSNSQGHSKHEIQARCK